MKVIKNMARTAGLLLLLLLGWSCSSPRDGSEKYPGKYRDIVEVNPLIKEFDPEEVMIGSFSQLHLIADYLMIRDHKSMDKLVHLFNKSDFSYVTSIADRGEGPGEIVNIGHIAIDDANRTFYINDHGKNKIFAYQLDSILAYPEYLPAVKMNMQERQFPSNYFFINDTLSIGEIIEPTGNYGFVQSVGKWNMNTGEVTKIGYEHPDIDKKRVRLAVSTEHGIYVEGYTRYDLLTISTLEGELKYNVYGSGWKDSRSKAEYYWGITFAGDKIVAMYLGEEFEVPDGKGGMKDNYPTKILVFNLEGDYLKTLETGYRLCDFCYDVDNNRLIMVMDDRIQFGYLDLDGII